MTFPCTGAYDDHMQTAIPIAVARIDHVLLLVDGMERTLAFYEHVLGCRLQHRLPQYAMAELAAGDSQIDLVDVSAPEGEWALPAITGGRNVDHVGLRAHGEESAIRAHLHAHGIAIIEERLEQDGERPTLSLYVRDPSSNTIELLITPAPLVAP